MSATVVSEEGPHVRQRLFFFSSVYGRTRDLWEFLGQGMNPTCAVQDLRCSCSNGGSFNTLRWARD